jgi:hypothetical protein
LLEQIADRFKDKEVVFAKVDATINAVSVPTTEFPAIIFYPKGNKENAIVYSGERNLDALEKFIVSK